MKTLKLYPVVPVLNSLLLLSLGICSLLNIDVTFFGAGVCLTRIAIPWIIRYRINQLKIANRYSELHNLILFRSVQFAGLQYVIALVVFFILIFSGYWEYGMVMALTSILSFDNEVELSPYARSQKEI